MFFGYIAFPFVVDMIPHLSAPTAPRGTPGQAKWQKLRRRERRMAISSRNRPLADLEATGAKTSPASWVKQNGEWIVNGIYIYLINVVDV